MITITKGYTHGYHVYKDGENVGFINGNKLSYDEDTKKCEIYYETKLMMILHNVIIEK